MASKETPSKMVKFKAMEPKKALQELDRLKGERANFENIWQEIADWMLPRKNNIQGSHAAGEAKYNNILDSTGMTSLELLAGALHGMLTNPSGYFFSLSTGKPELDENDNVRKWIQDTVRAMHYRLNNSNFQTEVQEFYLDLCAFGMGNMSVEDDEKDVVRFNARNIQEIYVKEDSRGLVNTLYRCYQLDAGQLVDDFGYDNLPEQVTKDYDSGKSCKYDIVNAVYPSRRVLNQHPAYNKIFGFVSQYIFVPTKMNLDIKGFKEFPYLTPRWSKITGEAYGRGPGEKALPETKVVNKMTETTLKGAQKVVDPPLQVPDDGFILPLVTRPAGLNFYRAGSEGRIEPIFADSRIDFGFQAIQNIQSKIREAFYIDQLKLNPTGPQMTAQEVSERVEQALKFLGPMLGRQQAEFLQPLVERLFAIMDRHGEIPTAPNELTNVQMKVQYSSVMAMAQRASENQNIQRTVAAIAPFASADPSVLDNFDGDVAVHTIAKLNNFPQEILRDKKAVAAIRDARAKAQQAQQQAVQQQEQAAAVQQLATAGAKAKQGAGQAVG